MGVYSSHVTVRLLWECFISLFDNHGTCAVSQTEYKHSRELEKSTEIKTEFQVKTNFEIHMQNKCAKNGFWSIFHPNIFSWLKIV